MEFGLQQAGSNGAAGRGGPDHRREGVEVGAVQGVPFADRFNVALALNDELLQEQHQPVACVVPTCPSLLSTQQQDSSLGFISNVELIYSGVVFRCLDSEGSIAMARWLRMLLPALVVVAWLAAVGLGGPTFGKLSDVSTNDQAGFLSASAESTTAGEWQERFRDSDAVPAIAVVEFDEPIQPQQLADYAPLAERRRTRPAWSAAARIRWWVRSRPKTSGRCKFIVPVPEDLDTGEVVTDLRAVRRPKLPESATRLRDRPGRVHRRSGGGLRRH